MIFSVDVVIPPNTTYTNPVIESIQMTRGTITKVFVLFPPGCVNLAKVVVREKEHQLWPSLEGTEFAGDTYPIEFGENYVLSAKPYVLDVVAWNIDNLYPHTVTVMINLLTGIEGWFSFFKQALGN